jgi:hypothetical protein
LNFIIRCQRQKGDILKALLTDIAIFWLFGFSELLDPSNPTFAEVFQFEIFF